MTVEFFQTIIQNKANRFLCDSQRIFMKNLICKRFYRAVFLFSVFMFSQSITTAQEVFEEQPAKNWLIEYGIPSEPLMNFRYENYSKTDTVRFREKLKAINESTPKSEWEGVYIVGSQTVGFSQFRWNSKVGFISFYIYTCLPELRHINYGSIVETPDYIELVPEKTDDSPRKAASVRFAKVKFGKDFYLVEESSLPAFMEKAVGILVEPEDASDDDYMKWFNFMAKGEQNEPFEGVPEVSAKYKHLLRFPIEAEISAIEKRTVEEGKILGQTIHGGETAFYKIRINAGKNKNVKVGMKFDIPETKEELVITKVNQNSSIGLVARSVDDYKNDACYGDVDGEYKEIACPQIRPSLKIKTQTGRLYEF